MPGAKLLQTNPLYLFVSLMDISMQKFKSDAANPFQKYQGSKNQIWLAKSIFDHDWNFLNMRFLHDHNNHKKEPQETKEQEKLSF